MPDDEPEPQRAEQRRPMLTQYGVVSACLAVLALVASVLAGVVFVQHRHHTAELRYRTEVLQAAADWTNVLVNMNKDTVDDSLAKLREGTVGRLNADFDAAVQPYRQLVQTLAARTAGQVDSVAMESIGAPESVQLAPSTSPPEPSAFASRTDTVLVVATSVSQNAGAKDPQTVRWNLRLDVADVDGTLLISRLEPIR